DRYRARQTRIDFALLGIELELVGFELVLVVLVLVVVLEVGGEQLATGLIGDLELLDQLVALVLVDGRVVGDEHPVGGVEVACLEDLVIDLGRVVDDDQHLGLRVEVRAGTDRELVELKAARVLHCRVYTRLARTCGYGVSSSSVRVTSASTSSRSSPWRARRSL